MFDERPESYNIGSSVVGDKYVSTAAIASSAPTIGYYMQYETIIWEMDGGKRASMIDQIIHKNEREARKVHVYITNNLSQGVTDI